MIKPLRDAGGNGICFLDLNKSENGRRELRNVLLNYKEYIIQAELKQSSTVSRLHEHSINTFRVVTYICDDKLYHSPVAMRVGQGGKRVDNCAEGGLGVGVNENGDLMKYGYYHDHKHELRVEKIEEHPDSHIKFEGYHIPNFNGIIETAYRVHGRLSGYGIISWDIMLDEKDEPVVVEVNLRWPNIDFIQEVCGLPCFGDNTEKMINMLNS